MECTVVLSATEAAQALRDHAESLYPMLPTITHIEVVADGDRQLLLLLDVPPRN